MRIGQFLRELDPLLRKQLAWGELYHSPQGIGRAFSPNSLQGYFNDLTSKTRHRGPFDLRGTPLLTGPRAVPFYHPVVICQWGLGHYDAWLISRDPAHRDSFAIAARWLAGTQDAKGGWPAFDLGRDPAGATIRTGIPLGWHDSDSPYSAMVQGQALSVLARAEHQFGSNAYRQAAQSAWGLMQTDVDHHGVYVDTPDGPCLLEAPGRANPVILNGWVFGLFGIWDYWMSTGLNRARDFFLSGYAALVKQIVRFDLGWWSAYDSQQHVAKPFYHHLHIAHLSALDMVFNDPAIHAMAAKWQKLATLQNTLRARSVYSIQRLHRLTAR